jgi:transcriptional regulator with XRE-family HTH domain
MYSSKSGSGRRRWNSKQRQRLLARFHQSQLTQRDFAGRQPVGLSTLRKWVRVETEAAPPSVKFQEAALPNIPLRYAVEVVSPQGWTARLQNSSENHERLLRERGRLDRPRRRPADGIPGQNWSTILVSSQAHRQ